MAEAKWTVFYGLKDGGNQAPLVGFSKIKVKKTSDGSTLEKNKAHNDEAGAKTATVQSANFVTVVAESAEEACKVVDAIVSGNVNTVSGSVVAGPQLAGNYNGKYIAALSSNLEEVAVMP